MLVVPEAARGGERGRCDDAPICAVYGIRLATTHRFLAPLPKGDGPVELTFEPDCFPGSEVAPIGPPAYQSQYRSDDGESVLAVNVEAEGYRFDFPATGVFHLSPTHIRLARGTDASDELVELRLLGPVLAFWLEAFRGTPALHASAVAAGASAAVFLADRHQGKSSLAAALMRRGLALLTDDIVAVTTEAGAAMVHPGYPQMRMWPAEAQHFVGRAEGLLRVLPAVEKLRVPVGVGGFGEFHPHPLPLGRLYLPARQDGGGARDRVKVEPVPPAQALIELVRGSFSARILAALKREGGRLEALARVVQCVQVRRLSYPAGIERLNEVAEAILKDLAV
ncbi:MAG: hypothetical protein V1750_11440 [Acidobacteriota bacterium]